MDLSETGFNPLEPVVSAPPDLVPVGFIKHSIGIKGDLKVVYEKSFFNSNKHIITESFFSSFDIIWITTKFSIFSSNVLSVVRCKDYFKLNLGIVNNRETADTLTGAFVEVPQSRLAKNFTVGNKNRSLINLKIVNLDGKTLGTVDKVDGNGFHDWIFSGDLAIPIVEKHIKNVDLLNRKILVDWEESWK